MNRNLFVIAVALTLALGARAEIHNWESAQGSVIEAELAFAGEELVVLRKADGTELALKIDQLSATSKSLLKALRPTPSTTVVPKAEATTDTVPTATPSEPVTTEAGETPSTPVANKTNPTEPKEPVSLESSPPGVESLSVFSEGRWKGLHAVYEHAKFDAVIDEMGLCRIFLKNDDGERIPAHPIALAAYAPREDGVNRATAWAASEQPASLQPEEISIRSASHCTIEDDHAHFRNFIRFEDNTITFWGHLEKDKLETPSVFHHALSFGAPFGIDGNAAALMDTDKAKEVAIDSRIEFDGGKGELVSYPLWDTHSPELNQSTALAGHHEVTIELTPFTPRILKIVSDPENFDHNRPVFGASDSRTLAYFGIMNWKADRYSDEDGEWLMLTIE